MTQMNAGGTDCTINRSLPATPFFYHLKKDLLMTGPHREHIRGRLRWVRNREYPLLHCHWQCQNHASLWPVFFLKSSSFYPPRSQSPVHRFSAKGIPALICTFHFKPAAGSLQYIFTTDYGRKTPFRKRILRKQRIARRADLLLSWNINWNKQKMEIRVLSHYCKTNVSVIW